MDPIEISDSRLPSIKDVRKISNYLNWPLMIPEVLPNVLKSASSSKVKVRHQKIDNSKKKTREIFPSDRGTAAAPKFSCKM